MSSAGAVMIGSQTPRYKTVPQGAVSTWGDEAIDLMATVGVALDPGQRDIVVDGMSEGADRKWLASEVADIEPRQNGKGVILETRALAGMLLVKEPLIVWTAHEFKTAHKGFERVRGYFDNFDHLRKRVRTIRSSTHSTEIILRTGQTLAFLARSGGSGRGFAGVSPLFLDEAFALTEEQVAAISYATRAAPNPQVWYMSSAPLPASDVLRDMCKRGRRGSRDLVYYEWSASGRYADLLKLAEQNRAMTDEDEDTPAGQELRRRLFEAAAESNRAFGVRISPKSVIRDVRKGSEQFLREGLGVFSELETGAAIDMEMWRDLGDSESRRDGDVALAVDISLQRDWAAIGLYGLRADGVGHVQLVDYRAGTDWIVDRLAELRTVLDPVAVGMARGTYASLKEDLKAAGFVRPEDRPAVKVRGEDEESHPPLRGDLAVLSGTDMAAACGQIIDAVRQSTVRHVPSEQLTTDVGVGRTRKIGDTIAWSGSGITGLVTVTEARWVFCARVDAVRVPDYDPVADIL